MKSFFRLAAVSLRDGTRRVLFAAASRLFFSPCGSVLLLPQQALQLRKKSKFTFYPYNSTHFVLYYTKGRVESLA